MPTEILARRGLLTKTYDNGNGSRTYAVYGGPVHYKDTQGVFQDIALGWSDAGDSLATLVNAFTVQAHKEVTTGGVVFGIGAASLTMVPGPVGYFNASTKALHTIAQPTVGVTPIVDGADLSYVNIYPQTTIKLSHQPCGLKETITIASKPTLPDPTSLGWLATDTWLCWTVKVNWAGWTPQGITNGTEHSGQVTLSWANGVAYLPPMWAVGADGHKLRVVRRFVRTSGQWYIIYGIPYKATQVAQFPIVVDPSTTVYDASDGRIVYYNGSYSYTSTSPSQEVGQDVAYNSKGYDYYWFRAFEKFTLSGWAQRTIGTPTNIQVYDTGNSGGSWTIICEEIADYGTLDSSDWGATSLATITSTFPHAQSAWNSADLQTRFIVNKNSSPYCVRFRGTLNDLLGTTTAFMQYYNSSNGTSAPKLTITYYETQTQSALTSITATGMTANWTATGGLVTGDLQEVWYQAAASDPGWVSGSADPAANGWTLASGSIAYNAATYAITGLSGGTKYWVRVREVQVRSSTHYPGAVSGSQTGTTSGGGGTTVTIAGTLTSAGTLAKQSTRALVGALTSSGILLTWNTKVLAGVLATAGALSSTRGHLLSLSGVLTSSGALARAS